MTSFQVFLSLLFSFCDNVRAQSVTLDSIAVVTCSSGNVCSDGLKLQINFSVSGSEADVGVGSFDLLRIVDSGYEFEDDNGHWIMNHDVDIKGNWSNSTWFFELNQIDEFDSSIGVGYASGDKTASYTTAVYCSGSVVVDETGSQSDITLYYSSVSAFKYYVHEIISTPKWNLTFEINSSDASYYEYITLNDNQNSQETSDADYSASFNLDYEPCHHNISDAYYATSSQLLGAALVRYYDRSYFGTGKNQFGVTNDTWAEYANCDVPYVGYYTIVPHYDTLVEYAYNGMLVYDLRPAQTTYISAHSWDYRWESIMSSSSCIKIPRYESDWTHGLSHQGITDSISFTIDLDYTVYTTLTSTLDPSLSPSKSPSESPSKHPTYSPTSSPSQPPTGAPSSSPTILPTDAPSFSPTLSPTHAPSTSPIDNPTSAPTHLPTFEADTSDYYVVRGELQLSGLTDVALSYNYKKIIKQALVQAFSIDYEHTTVNYASETSTVRRRRLGTSSIYVRFSLFTTTEESQTTVEDLFSEISTYATLYSYLTSNIPEINGLYLDLVEPSCDSSEEDYDINGDYLCYSQCNYTHYYDTDSEKCKLQNVYKIPSFEPDEYVSDTMRIILFFIGMVVLFPLSICCFYYSYKGWFTFRDLAKSTYNRDYLANAVDQYHTAVTKGEFSDDLVSGDDVSEPILGKTETGSLVPPEGELSHVSRSNTTNKRKSSKFGKFKAFANIKQLANNMKANKQRKKIKK